MRGLDSFEIEALIYVGIFVGVLIAYEESVSFCRGPKPSARRAAGGCG